MDQLVLLVLFMALSRKYRLSDSSEIIRVIKKGRSFDSKFFRIKFLPADAGFTRFSIIISSKVSKKAVIRNKIKRTLSETIRLNIPKIKPGFSIVVLVKPKAPNAGLGYLKESLVENLVKIN